MGANKTALQLEKEREKKRNVPSIDTQSCTTTFPVSAKILKKLLCFEDILILASLRGQILMSKKVSL